MALLRTCCVWAALLGAGEGCSGDVSGLGSTAEDSGPAQVDGPKPAPDQGPGTKPEQGPGTKQDQGTLTKPDQIPGAKQDQGSAAKQDQGPVTKQDQWMPSKFDFGPMFSDLWLPDSKQSNTAGGPCPCAAGLVCMGIACRAECNKPSDACGVASNCPAGQACVSTNYQGKYVCVPGVGAGKPCAKAFCADNRICASVNKKPLICLPTCTKHLAKCGSGGVCLLSTKGSCMFCSKP